MYLFNYKNSFFQEVFPFTQNKEVVLFREKRRFNSQFSFI
jgi:hypothetical protein